MDSPNDKSPFSMTETPLGQPTMNLVGSVDSSGELAAMLPVRTDLLYQIAAVTAGIILLVTAL